MTCPVCQIEFSTPYVREAWRTNAPVYCPKGHKLEFHIPLTLKPAEEQIEALERMFAK
jgi:hypothetical protein